MSQREASDTSGRAEEPKEAAVPKEGVEPVMPDLEAVLREIGPAPNGMRIVAARDIVPPSVPERANQPAATSVVRTVKAGEVLEQPKPDAQALALVRQAEAAIAEFGAGPGHAPMRVLAEQVERVGAFIIRQMAELDAARAAVGRLTGEHARLVEENRQMREVLKGLLQAVEADKRRANEAAGRISQRLASILPSGGATNQPSPSSEAAVKKAS